MGDVYKPGQVVELNDGRLATVRFAGETSFAPGQWIGVEFEDAVGKNDGSVQGQRYFQCDMAHGMFLRPTGVGRIVEQPKPAAAAPKANDRAIGHAASASKGRSASIAMDSATKGRTASVSRPASISRPASRPSSIMADSRAAGPPSGASSPVKRPLSTAGAARPRQSMAPPPTTKRMSMAPTPSPAPTTRHTSRPSLGGASLAASNKTPSASSSSTGTKTATSRPSLALKRSSPGISSTPKAPPSAASTTTSATASVSATAHKKEVEELEAKLRVMEKKRLEDREKLKSLDKLQEERDRFETIIQKLQAKYQPLQQENVDLKKQLKEGEARLEEIEVIQAEHDTIVEMATLDREMAEEQADALRVELEALKQKAEELELENEILKEENHELGQEMSPEEKTSQGWLQLERENERLRAALLRLRDMSQEQEAELKDQIQSLEEDVQDLSAVKQQYDDAKARLLECEADIEDLRQQLDAALGAEDMIEELTERNLVLNEQIEDLKATIDDLQSLKELNDELEINHVENEKQLQEVIDFKDSLLIEQARRSAQYEETLADQEYTLSRFRELVTNLQSDLEDMRASKEITESEAQELNSRSRAMMDLNRQLQASATSTKIKTIDMELRKLEAQEAAEHLAIVQLFLPEAFHTERDSVLALLRFKRIGFKAHLLHGFVKDNVAGADQKASDEDIFEACDVLDKLTWVSAMCDRFINSICSCSLEQFARFEGALYELEPVERALNGYIENVKKDELKERQVADELHRSIALMSHLAETHLGTGLENYADDVLMRTLLMQSHLETTASALSILTSSVRSSLPASSEDDEDDNFARFINKAESMISHSRSAKVVVGKTIRSLQELKSRSLSLSPTTLPSFEECETGTAQLALYARKLGDAIRNFLHEESREGSEPFTLSDIRSIIFKTTEQVFSMPESDIFSTLGTKLRALTDALVGLSSLAADLDHTSEFEKAPAPWVLRAKELAASKIVSIDAEEEIRRLKDEIHARATQLKLRDQEREEMGVKIELLEARTKDAKRKESRIRELEASIEESKARERTLADEVEKRAKELASLEDERDRLVRTVERQKRMTEQDDKGKKGGELAVATEKEMLALKGEISALEKANRFLRKTGKKEIISKERAENDWLNIPVLPTLQQQQLLVARPLSAGKAKPRTPRKALEDITNLPSVAQLVDLTKAHDAAEPRGRLKWRPRIQTPQYQLSEQEMRRAEAWSAWDLWDGGKDAADLLMAEQAVFGWGNVGIAV